MIPDRTRVDAQLYLVNILVQTLEHLAQNRDRQDAASAPPIERQNPEPLLPRLAGRPVVNSQHRQELKHGQDERACSACRMIY